jgi:hypothetical protein
MSYGLSIPHPTYKRGAIITIIRTEKPDGSIQLSLTESDWEYAQAAAYQEARGLSTTRGAIKARLKTWRRQRDELEQEGANGVEWVEIP